jgi:hypothetical protein
VRVFSRGGTLGGRACKPRADQLDYLLDAETMREHDRFGAAVAAGGEQFERATATDDNADISSSEGKVCCAVDRALPALGHGGNFVALATHHSCNRRVQPSDAERSRRIRVCEWRTVSDVPYAIGRKVMKRLTVAVLTMGAIISLAGPAAAQGVYFDLGPGPGPRPYYRDYDEPRYYRGERLEREYNRPGRFRTWNGCQPGWTVQDGLCKPYRGR